MNQNLISFSIFAAAVIGSSGWTRERLRLESKDILSPQKALPFFKLKLIASVDSPVVNGTRLQAVSFSQSQDLVFVSYAVAGELQAGAIDVISVRDPQRPKLSSERIFPRHDINALTNFKNEIFAVGAEQDIGAAALKLSFDKNGKLGPNVVSSIIPSYAGTGVTASENGIFVSSGNTGGVYKLSASDLRAESVFPSPDSRHLAYFDQMALLSGQSPNLTFLDKNLKVLKTIDLNLSLLPESKASIQQGKHKSLLALADKGTQLICNRNGKVLYSIPAPSHGGYSVSNGVSGKRNLVATANGEAGVNLYFTPLSTFEGPLCLKTQPIKLGAVNLGERYSANSVLIYKDFIFVATGSGGFKVLKYSY